MRILVFSPVPTHPPIAGNRARILTLTEALSAAGHELHFGWVPMEEGDSSAMKAHFGESYTEFNYRPPKLVKGFSARIRRRILSQFKIESAYVWRLDDWYDPGLTAQLGELHAKHHFDAVFVEYVFMSQALSAFPADVIKIIDTHDRFANRHLHYLQAGKRPGWYSTTPEEETKGLARADVVIAIQDNEAKLFDEALHGSRRVITVGHLLDMSESVQLANSPTAVFIASGNPINLDAAEAFITGALPLILATIPEFKLLLAGDVCKYAQNAPGVCKLGRVSSIANTYAQGALAINPVRMGTGLNIKTMECLAMGVPLVSTQSGSRGLENLRGKAFLSVEDNDIKAMADAVINVLKDKVLRTSLSQEALLAAQHWNATQLTSLAEAIRLSMPVTKIKY